MVLPQNPLTEELTKSMKQALLLLTTSPVLLTAEEDEEEKGRTNQVES